MKRPGRKPRNGGLPKPSVEVLCCGFLPSPEGSELYLCPTNCVLSDKGARSARPGRSPESNAFLTDIMNTDRKRTLHPPTPSYKYSFRLNEEQNIRFNELLCKTGLEHNRSRFIVKRIFGEEFVVIKRDPSKTQFFARLNDFYFQCIVGFRQSGLVTIVKCP